MKIAIVGITGKGCSLALALGEYLVADIYIKDIFKEKAEGISYKEFTEDFVGDIFQAYDVLIFIMATGIAVRSIAPHIKGKYIDPAVIVMDDCGKHVISLLGGHSRDANFLTKKIAGLTGGYAVITTATDVNDVLAFDILAKRNGFQMENPKVLKYISSAMLQNEEISFFTDGKIEGVLPDNVKTDFKKRRTGVTVTNKIKTPDIAEKTLVLRPQNLILGIGCRRGTIKEAIEDAVKDFLADLGYSINSLKLLTSIDLKRDERGILEFSKEINLPFLTFPAEEIKKKSKDCLGSKFVESKTGVTAVAAPSALLASINAILVKDKTKYPGITLALAEDYCVTDFNLKD